jgi:hypothetical protein
VRDRLTWIVVGSVVAVLFVAVVDALRGSSESATTVSTGTQSTKLDDETRRALEEELERTGNRWARLFGAGRKCPRVGRYMTQPACERVLCKTHSGPIPNCTPLSSELRASFAGATVEEVVIRPNRDGAAARFSNGETVLFHLPTGLVSKVGGNAGRWFVH